MIVEKFYINNSEVLPPKNWKGVFIELNYGKDQFPNANTISITDFEWVRENYDWFQQYIEDGLAGGAGIFEAPPFRIDLVNGSQTYSAFNGYIDLTNGSIFTNKKGNLTGSDGVIIGKAVSNATVDWLNQVAGGFMFEYLASDQFKATGRPGYISSDMYVFVPYVNSKVPNYEQAALATLMVFEIGKSIKDAVTEIYNLIAEMVVNWSDIEITEIIKLVIKVLYLIVLIATIIKLIEDMVKYIISPVKYHAGMLERDLMSKAVEYLSEGKMAYISDIHSPSSEFYNEVIIPPKYFNEPSKSDNSIFGFLVPDKNEQVGWYKGTFAQLIDAMKIKYNAKIVVTADANGVGSVQLLRKDKNAKPPAYHLPDVFVPKYSFNTDEFSATYEVLFTVDGQDQNTLQNYAGTAYQVVTQPKVVNYRPFVMTKNLTTASIPFAKAVRKTKLTSPEEIINPGIKEMIKIMRDLTTALKPLLKAYDKMQQMNKNIASIFNTIKPLKKVFSKASGLFNSTAGQIAFAFSGGITSPVATLLNARLEKLLKTPLLSISDRIGMMLLSDDHFSVHKCVIMDISPSGYKYNRINVNNEKINSAENHWYKFHYVNSFVPKQINGSYSDRPTGNQYKIQHFEKIPFTWDDFLKVVANNRIYDFNNNEAVVESLKFNPYLEQADIKVRFSELYTLNLVETFLNPTGA